MAQPPNQPPPQGGFGAPQDQPPQQPPPPGGVFGPPQPAPQTPPPPRQPPQTPPQPPPGYGYPQQPPQPPHPSGTTPGPSGPYATPGPYAPPGPYTTPGYGYPQPGYGYPAGPPGAHPGAPGAHPGTPGGAPGMPTPPPPGPPGPRGPFRGKPAMIIGAAVAVLLVVGGTVFAVTRGDDGGKEPVAEKSGDTGPTASDDPVNPGDGDGDGEAGPDPDNLNEGREDGDARVLWYKEAPDAPGDGADAPGMWITDTAAVKAAYKQVFAYAVGDGTPAWDPIAFPQPICAVTPEKTADDTIVVAYMSGSTDRAKCNQLQEIDLATGAKGWKGEIPDGALFDSTLSVELSVAGDTLMVGRSQSGTAFDITTGKKLFDAKRYDETCFPSGFAGSGGRLLQVASCGAGTENEHDEMRELDPRTGKAKWTQRFDNGWQVARTYSVDPLVVYSTHDEKDQWNISVLGADGAVTSQVLLDETFAPECDWAILQRNLTGCQGVAADADTLYLPTEAVTGANEIVAIGLADGKEKWRVESPTDRSMQPLRIEDGELIAYVGASYDGGGRVVSIPIAGNDREPVTLLQNPSGAAEVEAGFFSRDMAWADGRFYLSATRLTGSDDAKEKLMLAYGE
ncbi:PQQ-binding-like beta-propeller repeat protein [Streptomyces sp. NPDC093252]|uniref:outer membrane protein assembly factor BamB family protein n=1 Tax=Streptomyces sp. NPDC093252 TaxID=3154980 RepID=UPI003430B3DD